MVDRAKSVSVKWNDEHWLGSTKEALVRAADRFPEAELKGVEDKFSRDMAMMDDECEEDAVRSAELMRSELLGVADIGFSVDLIKPSDLHLQAFNSVKEYIDVLTSAQGLSHEVSEGTEMILRLPFRLRNHMKGFFGIYENGETDRLDELVNKIVVAKLTNLKAETSGVWAKVRGLFKGEDESPDLTQFFEYMRVPLDSMKQAWAAAVTTAIDEYCQSKRVQQVREKKSALDAIRVVDAEKVIDDACSALKHEWGDGSDHELVCSVNCRMRNSTIYCDWTEEQWEPASERLEVWKVNPGLPTTSSFDRCSCLGGVRLEKGEQILSVFTVQASSVVIISVSAEGTFVRRAQFPSQ
ncbi:hypothetical protein Poli38472_014577 [Pythium oligandrum]|uniref:Uncharacterized protein n=1 Tax=Pythium oligandrum TaxID=41045 RepID=A0A8K1FKZ6_PYTOL|nr:hypothetical protein Poli38472_014577 [Pythium oligandrum]|eukprot:TMW66601.1 hypothetical protein Poli38472_014577 [Pythium oligandrum]